MRIETLEETLRTYLEEGVFYREGEDYIPPHSHGKGQTNPGIGVAEFFGDSIPALSDKTVPYYKDGVLTEDTVFTWDEITKRLGIGINSPARELHVHSTGTLSRIKITNATSGSGANDGGEIKMAGTALSFFNNEGLGTLHIFTGGTSSTSGIYIDLSNRVGIGHTSPDTSSRLHLHLGSGTSFFILDSFSELIADSTTTVFRKARGSQGVPTTVTSGYIIGTITFDGYNGTNYQIGAKLHAEATETHSVTVRGTELRFYTTPNTTATLLERLRIRDDGYLDYKNAAIALGGGSAATLGTIGGSGPTNTAQKDWGQIYINGVVRWIALFD